MNGIYIHIPFCRKACHYCNFHFSVSSQNRDGFIRAITNEIEVQQGYFKKEENDPKSIIDTVYFGGGTPSLLSQDEISEILAKIQTCFSIKEHAEISLEANPEDLTNEKLRDLKKIGINRLSIGIQSFFDEDLLYMNRPHNAQKALDVISQSRNAGFENISIDLIYALPILTNEKWFKNLAIAFENKIPHISLYSLTVEPKTPLAHYIKKGKYQPIDDKKSAEQYVMAMNEMKKNGYNQYELSNFCLNDHYSIHNSNYWKNQSYLGIGPSAHSYNGISRHWNIRNTTEYIKSLYAKRMICDQEILSITQKYNEYLMTSLRTIWGCDLDQIKNNFGQEYFDHCYKIAEQQVKKEQVEILNNTIYLTKKGKLFADQISAELFFNK